MSFITRAYGATKLAVKAKGPTIMVVSGIASMGASVVLASKQTLKVEEVLAKHVPDLDKIKKGQDLELQGYTEQDAAKDRGKVYAKTAVDLGKLYAVPAVFFFGGAALVFGGHRIMLKRQATLAIAFTGLQSAFDKYRANVIETAGHETDQRMMNGGILKDVIDPETGKVETIVTRDWDADRNDPYNRVFEEGRSTQWRDDLGVNKMFLMQQQKLAQRILNLQGYIYLNDIYEALGFEKTAVGQVTGWKVRKLPDGSKDIPFVDFGLDKALPNDWKFNKENAIFLDFNCQGLIVGGHIQKILEQA